MQGKERAGSDNNSSLPLTTSQISSHNLSLGRDAEPARKYKPRKYLFTPEQDALIRKTYENGTGTGPGRVPVVRILAAKLGVPKWALCKRAAEIGAYQPRVKEKPWNERELHVLELNAMRTPAVIQRRLKVAGFKRSLPGIMLKRKRLALREKFERCSARAVAELFGVDPSTVADAWIRKGLLKAERKGTTRTAQQGGDEWFIKEKDIRAFIMENVGIIDFRKIDKYWLVDLLAGSTLGEHDSAGQGEEYIEQSSTNLRSIK